MTDRYDGIARALWRVLFANLAVALAKIALGAATGAVSILSDGFHSLTDSASNVVGLVGIAVARRPPDENHPYGHRKYETIAAVGILLFLLVALVQIVRAAVASLLGGGRVQTVHGGIALMLATLAVNLVVVAYERRQGRRLNSEILLADARHTQSDVLTSTAVVLALVGVALGYPILDPLAGLVVAGFIGRACWEIAQDASRTLSDAIVIAEDAVRAVVQSVPGVLGSEKIRTRGSADHAFLDLHLWLDGNTTLDAAHATSHDVKDLLMARFPHLADVIIHIEPPPANPARRTGQSKT